MSKKNFLVGRAPPSVKKFGAGKMLGYGFIATKAGFFPT